MEREAWRATVHRVTQSWTQLKQVSIACIGWKVGGKFKSDGTYINIYPWLIHVDAWQKRTQYCKTIILQLKIKKKSLSWWM